MRIERGDKGWHEHYDLLRAILTATSGEDRQKLMNGFARAYRLLQGAIINSMQYPIPGAVSSVLPGPIKTTIWDRSNARDDVLVSAIADLVKLADEHRSEIEPELHDRIVDLDRLVRIYQP